MSNVFYRSFLNMDSGELPKIWNESDYVSLYGHEISEKKFGELVLNNLFFDPRHLIVAIDPNSISSSSSARNDSTENSLLSFLSDGEAVGFVHGGFGPNKAGTGPDFSVGYIAQLVVKERADKEEIRENLLHEMEKVFAEMGISRVYAGSVYPNAPFYSNLIQGCELNGIHEKDLALSNLLTRNRYVMVGTHHIFRFRLERKITLDFPEKQRRQNLELIYRNSLENQTQEFQIKTTCWENCFYSQMQKECFILIDKRTQEPIAWVGVRKLNESFDVVHFGLHQLFVKEEYRRQGNARLFLKLVLNQLHDRGRNSTVELQVPAVNLPAMHTFSKLKFDLTSKGNVFMRKIDATADNQNQQ